MSNRKTTEDNPSEGYNDTCQCGVFVEQASYLDEHETPIVKFPTPIQCPEKNNRCLEQCSQLASLMNRQISMLCAFITTEVADLKVSAHFTNFYFSSSDLL